MKAAPAQSQATEVDVIIRDLKNHRGVSSYMILNNDGIVIKHENMEYKRAVQLAHLVLDLLAKVKRSVRGVCDPPDNEVESVRLKARDYELLVGQSGSYTLAIVQQQGAALPSQQQQQYHHQQQAQGQQQQQQQPAKGAVRPTTPAAGGGDGAAKALP